MIQRKKQRTARIGFFAVAHNTYFGQFEGLAYYYEGKAESLHRKVATTFIVGNSILNAQGVPMCGCVGNDGFGEDALNVFKKEGIDVQNVKKIAEVLDIEYCIVR